MIQVDKFSPERVVFKVAGTSKELFLGVAAISYVFGQAATIEGDVPDFNHVAVVEDVTA